MRYPSAFLSLALVLGGCSDDSGTQQGPLIELQFTLEEDSIVAGSSVGYIAVLDSQDVTVPAEIEILSDLEPDLDRDEEALTPFVSGMHELTAIATFSGETYEASLNLEVRPEVAYRLDLQMADVVTDVGVPVSYALVLVDEYDNALDTAEVQFDIDPNDLTLIEDQFVSTIPGVYEITASLPHDDPELVLSHRRSKCLQRRAASPSRRVMILVPTSPR